MSYIIELKDISFSAQGNRIVHETSFQYEEEKTIALVGPSGCGKSTILKLSAGLIIPDEGEVLYKGKAISKMNRQENLTFRRESGFVFQDSALWANQNLYQMLELPLKLHFPGMQKKERDDRINQIASEVGYRKNLLVRPSQLSMGEQKLLAFARAIICRPKLLYLDEWTESLDERSSSRLIDIVKKMQSEGVSIILINHKVSIIRELSDKVAVILGGKISYIFSKEQLKSDTELKNLIEGDKET